MIELLFNYFHMLWIYLDFIVLQLEVSFLFSKRSQICGNLTYNMLHCYGYDILILIQLIQVYHCIRCFLYYRWQRYFLEMVSSQQHVKEMADFIWQMILWSAIKILEIRIKVKMIDLNRVLWFIYSVTG